MFHKNSAVTKMIQLRQKKSQGLTQEKYKKSEFPKETNVLLEIINL